MGFIQRSKQEVTELFLCYWKMAETHGDTELWKKKSYLFSIKNKTSWHLLKVHALMRQSGKHQHLLWLFGWKISLLFLRSGFIHLETDKVKIKVLFWSFFSCLFSYYFQVNYQETRRRLGRVLVSLILPCLDQKRLHSKKLCWCFPNLFWCNQLPFLS